MAIYLCCIESELIPWRNGWFDPLVQYQAYYNFTVFPGNTYDYDPFNASIKALFYNNLYGVGNCVDQVKDCAARGIDEICTAAVSFPHIFEDYNLRVVNRTISVPIWLNSSTTNILAETNTILENWHRIRSHTAFMFHTLTNLKFWLQLGLIRTSPRAQRLCMRPLPPLAMTIGNLGPSELLETCSSKASQWCCTLAMLITSESLDTQ